jgi:hypothetical protein
MSNDNRRARRIVVNVPAVVESIGQPPVSLHPNLAAVYSRVDADAGRLGARFPGVVRDLSTNGAFVAGEPLPLLSRVTLKYAFLPRGIGILFEAVPLDARTAIARLVNRP